MEFLKSIMNIFGVEDTEENPVEQNPFEEIIQKTLKEHTQNSNYAYGIKVNKLKVYTDEIKNWADKKKVAFILYCIKGIDRYWKKRKGRSYRTDDYYDSYRIKHHYIAHLFRPKVLMDDEDAITIISSFLNCRTYESGPVTAWPLSLFLNQIKSQYKDKSISKKLETSLLKLKKEINSNSYYSSESDNMKLSEKIQDILNTDSSDSHKVKSVYFPGEDPLQKLANAHIQNWKNPAEQEIWFKILAKSKSTKGSKPTKKYLKDSKVLIQELGSAKFKKTLNEWFDFVIKLKETRGEHVHDYGDGNYYTYHSHTFICSPNATMLKGLIWMCSHFHDTLTLSNLSALAERSYKKVPGHGPIAPALGNACFYTLYMSKGLEGIGKLSRLKLRIKQPVALKIINRYLLQAASDKGISLHEIEDLSVDDFGLIEGMKSIVFGDFEAIIRITKPGRSELYWLKEGGKKQKSVPALVKSKFADKLKKLKQSKKQIDQSTSSQRDRIDRMFKANRTWSMEDFDKLFMQHGLQSFLAKKIIWTFTHEKEIQSAIFVDGKWMNHTKEIHPASASTISLWHPALHTVDEIEKWREFLIQKEIQQPLKQAFREVYLLTEAEINTKTYSNRMAAHILKQHQFVNLAKGRNWRASLQGAWDGGYDDISEILIPEHNISAQFWVQAVDSNDDFNNTGIWNYVSTDQIRFINTENNEVLELIDVPPVLFSEILRDVDLFVGVASVGNDPAWQDNGGQPQFRDYWQNYSFGNLSEIAKNRKSILKNLVPRLKIKDVAQVGEKFLVVKGKLRTYKIHMGSTNILMEPNDQYFMHSA